jgi:hypothetical protein
VLDKRNNVKVPIDWHSVVFYDGVPTMFLYRASGKALNFELISFFDWLEENYGITPNDFKLHMQLAKKLGYEISTMDEYFTFIKYILPNEALKRLDFSELSDEERARLAELELRNRVEAGEDFEKVRKEVERKYGVVFSLGGDEK